MQDRTNKPFTCSPGLQLALPGLLWLLWGKCVTAVIEAYIEESPPMHCDAGIWLHPRAPFQTRRKQFREERTDGCLRVRLRGLCKPNHATPSAIRKSLA